MKMVYFLKTLVYIDVLVAAGLLMFRLALLPRYRSLVSAKLIVIGLSTPAVALLCGNVYIFFSYLVALIAFNSRSRFELAGIFLFLLPSMPMLTQETVVGGVYLLAISTLTAMGAGALIATLVTRPRTNASSTRYDLAVLMLIGLFTFIYNRELNPTDLLRGLTINVLSFAGPYALIRRSAHDRGEVEALLLRWALGAAVLALAACFQAGRHWVLFETYFQALQVKIPLESAAASLRGGLLRTGGSMIDYSAGGLFLATVVVTLPMLRRAFTSIGYWSVLLLLLAGLLVSQSRGAWVAAFGGYCLVAAWRGQWGRVALVGGVAAVAGLSMSALGSTSRLAEILGTSGNAKGTADYRRNLLSQGLAEVSRHPLLGQPTKRLIQNLSDLTQGQHIVDFVNSHLFIAMAAGIPLFLAWCVIWLMPIIAGWRQRSSGSLLAAVPMAIIATAMIAMIFTSLVDRNLTWPLIALGFAPMCLRKARQVDRRATMQGRLCNPMQSPESLVRIV